MEQTFKAGDSVTFKSLRDVGGKYNYGGNECGGLKGTVDAIRSVEEEYGCYKIVVRFKTAEGMSMSYSMLESEFVEYESRKKVVTYTNIHQGKEIKFILYGNTHIYKVEDRFLLNPDGYNNQIFVDLKLDANTFCRQHYGYDVAGGEWPSFHSGDFHAAERVINALYVECTKATNNKIFTEQSDKAFAQTMEEHKRLFDVSGLTKKYGGLAKTFGTIDFSMAVKAADIFEHSLSSYHKVEGINVNKSVTKLRL
jgi:hypothetical protein